MRRRFISILAASVLVLLGATQKPQSEIIQLNGANHRLNYYPVYGSVPGEKTTAEEVVIIDGIGPDMPDEAVILIPQDVTSGPNGEIVVLDDKRVKIFDAMGNFILAFGREGHGPGEFEMPIEFLPLQSDRISVAEAYNGSIHQFDYSGKYIDRINLARRSSAFTIPARNGGYFAHDAYSESPGGERVRHSFIRRLDEHGNKIPFTTSKGEVDSLWIFSYPLGQGSLNPGCRVIPSPSGYAYTLGNDYTIYRFSEEGIHSAFRRVVNDVRYPRWYREYLLETVRAQGRDIDFADISTTLKVSPSAIAVDDRGHVWACCSDDGTIFQMTKSMRSFNRSRILPIDEFDAEGRWLRHWVIEIPFETTFFKMTHAAGNSLYGILFSSDEMIGDPVIRLEIPE